MKRHLNTSHRLVWNHITGTLVVASELARSRGKRAGVAIALSLAAVTSVPALAADTVVQAGETVSGGTLTNHDNQIVLGTANGMTISSGLEYGPDNEANTGGQWIQNGGIANNTTVTGGGLQRVNAGGSVSDTVTGTGPGGYPGAGPSDSWWQSGFLFCGTRSALTRHRHNHITPVFTFIFCLQRYHTMKIITRGEAMRIHRQHPASRLFPFCTGKYRWHGSAETYTGREVQDIPGVLAVFAERRKDSFGPYVRLMSVTLN